MVRAGPRIGRTGARRRPSRRSPRGACPHRRGRPRVPKATMVPASALRPAAAPDAAGHGDEPPPQSGARLPAGISVHEDLATAHAGARPGVRSAQVTADGAPHDQPPAAACSAPAQSPASPSTISSPSAHPRARRAVPAPPASVRRPPVMPAPEARDARQVARRRGRRPPPRPETVEQLAERRAAVAVPELEPLDLGPAQAGEPVGADAPRRRPAPPARSRSVERERHGTSSRRWKWCSPRLPP